MGFWPVVLHVLKNSDVVLLLVDARMPEISRNKEIIDKVESMGRKRLVIVFTKADLVSEDQVRALKEKYGGAYVVSNTKKKGVRALKNYLIRLSEEGKRKTLRIGLVGYPNVGKSSLLNMLSSKAKAKVSAVSGTTKKTQWIREGTLRFIDSPGVIPFSDAKDKLGMTAAKDPHKLKHPERVAFSIIEHLDMHHPGVLNTFYQVNASLKGNELFLAVGKRKGYLVKGGKIDEHRTAIRILEDWQRGAIHLR